MSLAIQSTKVQGDPGLFGFLGKAVGTIAKVGTSFLPGPAGAIARGITSRIFGGGGSPAAALPTVRSLPRIITSMAPSTPTRVSDAISISRMAPTQLPVPYQDPGTFVAPTGQVGIDATPAIGCPKGYKPNKAGYYRRIKTPMDPVGQVYYIQPESRCVKIRKRNSANPRAADRALNRIQSAKRFATKMNRVTIRKKCD